MKAVGLKHAGFWKAVVASLAVHLGAFALFSHYAFDFSGQEVRKTEPDSMEVLFTTRNPQRPDPEENIENPAEEAVSPASESTLVEQLNPEL